jgi:TonB family protein
LISVSYTPVEAPARSSQTSDEPQLHLILELEAEAARWRRRTMFLFSIIFHMVLIAVLLIEPRLFRSGARLLGINVEPERKRDFTFLTLPPDLQKPVRPPRTNRFSDKDRTAQGRSRVVNPNGMRMPYSRGNTQLPEIAGNRRPPTPPAPKPTPPQAPAPQMAQAPPGGQNSANNQHQIQLKAELEKPKLLDVPSAPEGGSKLHLPGVTPGDAIQQSLQEAVRGRAAGGGTGAGDGYSQFHNLNPNFSTEGPLILSDTRGVNFGPYLARIVYTVRRNWEAVIPESARLGEKGRVAIVFEILKDGSVPELRLVGPSGAEPLDRAALAGIRASIPFPPLPQEFTGNHLVLQFMFLYNLTYNGQ